MEWELCPTQRSDDKFLTAIHHNGIVTTDEHGVVFRCPNHIFCRLNKDITFPLLKEKAERKICPEGTPRKEVQRIRYRTINCQDDGSIRYSAMEIKSDDDVRTMMQLHANVPTGRQILELYIDVVNSTDAIMHLLRQPPPPPAPKIPFIKHVLCTIYCPGRMEYNRYGVYFEGTNIITFINGDMTTFNELHRILLEHEQQEWGDGRYSRCEITHIYYRCPRIRHGFPIDWSEYEITDDEDVKYMFMKHQRSQEWTRKDLELCVQTQRVLNLDT